MRRLFVFILMLVIWVILSGKLDANHLTMGLISSAFVTWISGDLIFVDNRKKGLRLITEFFGLLLYIPWLLWEVVVANFHVLRLAVTPGGAKEVKPRIVRYDTYLKSESARFVFANSITLTPGTITIRLEDHRLYIHAISEAAEQGLHGKMEDKVAKIFGEQRESS